MSSKTVRELVKDLSFTADESRIFEAGEGIWVLTQERSENTVEVAVIPRCYDSTDPAQDVVAEANMRFFVSYGFGKYLIRRVQTPVRNHFVLLLDAEISDTMYVLLKEALESIWTQGVADKHFLQNEIHSRWILCARYVARQAGEELTWFDTVAAVRRLTNSVYQVPDDSLIFSEDVADMAFKDLPCHGLIMDWYARGCPERDFEGTK